MSKLPRSLFSYFKQRFAEVTNPPIDPLREELVMSTRMLLGKPRQRAQRDAGGDAADRAQVADSAARTGGDAAGPGLPEFPGHGRCGLAGAIRRRSDAGEAGAALRAAVAKLCRDAEDAVRGGARILFISDETADVHTLPIPALLAVGAVHHHLIRQGLRMRASLVSVSGEPREVHHFAALIGYGANAVYPYLAYATVDEIMREGRKTGTLTVEQARQELCQGGGQGAAQGDEQDGHQHARRLLRRADLRGAGHRPGAARRGVCRYAERAGRRRLRQVAEDVLAWHVYGYPRARRARRSSW
jgi:hypothetical protein